MSDKTVKLAMTLGIALAGAQVTDVVDTGIPAAQWAAMTPDERGDRAHAEWREWIWEHIQGGAEPFGD